MFATFPSHESQPFVGFCVHVFSKGAVGFLHTGHSFLKGHITIFYPFLRCCPSGEM
jgi:hypothetical protein